MGFLSQWEHPIIPMTDGNDMKGALRAYVTEAGFKTG